MNQSKVINGDTSISLYSERGGVITSLKLRKKEILFQGMIEETLFDFSKSVKGGIPILFPNAGPLTDEKRLRSGYSLPQHGFARNNQWEMIHVDADGLTQRLISENVGQKDGYEWIGSITNRIDLGDNSCSLSYHITNQGEENSIPVSLGLHPYFDVPQGDKWAIKWNFEGGDQIAQEVETWSNDGTIKIDMPEDGILRVYIPGIGNLRIDADKEFKRLWIWSLPGKNFVCIEPVMGDEDAIVNNPPVMLQPGTFMKTGIRISLED